MNIKDLPIDVQEFINKQNNICYLTLAGSYSYGTNNENSDIDIRGCFLEPDSVIYGTDELEQIVDKNTDSVIYGIRKFIKLCSSCNPGIIELLGTRPEEVIYINDIGKKILDNRHIFLTKRAYVTFLGYATQQLRRLQNALAHDHYDEDEKRVHILKSIQAMMEKTIYQYSLEKTDISFDIVNDEIVINGKLNNIPVNKFNALNSSLTNMLRNYSKLNHRNNKKDDNHLTKHAMHLIRLYLTGLDILNKHEIITYRQNDLTLLRAIRAGEVPFIDVFKMANEFEETMKKAYDTCTLPETVDNKLVNNLLIDIYKNL